VAYSGTLKRTLLLTLVSLVPALFAQDAAEPLEKARDKALAVLPQLRNYVCVETINRSYYSRVNPLDSPRSCEQLNLDRKQNRYKIKLDATDRLRLAVAFPVDREVYSWTGSEPFTYPLENILQMGPLGTGGFASHLLDIFSNPAVRFHLIAETPDTLEYGFRVPVEPSRFLARAANEWLKTSYTGSFTLDRRSLEMSRFVVETGELPEQTSMCDTATTLDFKSHSMDWFVPSKVHSHDMLRDATETDRIIAFSDCREATPVPRQIGSNSKTAHTPLPPGLEVTLIFNVPIDSDVAAAGDTISATVREPVLSGFKVLVPTGAIVSGRILRMEHQQARSFDNVWQPPRFLVSVAFDTLEIAGVRSRFYARLERPALNEMLTRSQGQSQDLPQGTFAFVTGDRRYVVRPPFESH
jgi:hypothetical protein